MRLRGLAAATLASLVLVPATACGGADSGGDAKTLTYWASNQGHSIQHDKRALRPVLEDFSKKTGIDVDLEVISWTDLQTRIQTAITSGQGPDVVNIGNTWAASLQATGAFMEFGESEMADIGGGDKFVPSALATGGASGQPPTSVPLYGLAYGLYYNKAMFEQAGLRPPQTWEEMVSAAQKLTDPAKDVYGMSVAGGSYTENVHFAFINAAQNRSAWFDASGQPTFDSEENAAGILRYLDLMQDNKVVNPSNAQYDDATMTVSDFANGKAAMIISQNNADATIQEVGMKPSEYGVIPFPAPSGSDPVASHVAGINLSVLAESDNPDGALKLVDHLTSPAVQSELGEEFATLPVLQGEEPTFTSNPAEAETFQEIYTTRSEPLPLVPAEDQFETTVGQAMNAMFARIATGETVTIEDIRSELRTAQEQVAASTG